MRMFSQYGQDDLVLELLGGMCNGFFLDSGAADGTTSSNTRALEEFFGWNGICVEPNESLFADLVRTRRCRCLNCCLYDREGEVQFLERANTLGGIVGEYHPAHLQYAIKTFHLQADSSGRLATVQKPARSVLSILRECRAPRTIDYWSLDTEGSELAILRSFPFDEYSFRVLTVEHNWLPIRDQIRTFLESRGYRRHKAIEIDDCYVKVDHEIVPPRRSHVWTRIGRG